MAEQRDDDKPMAPSESQISGQIPPLGQTSATPQPSSDWPQPTTPASAINGVANGTANGAADAAAANVSNGYPASQVPPAFLQQTQPQAAAPQSSAVQMPPAQQSSTPAYQVQGYQPIPPYAVMPQQSQTVQPSQAVPQPQQAAPQQYAATQQSMPPAQFLASYAQQQSQQYAAMPQTMVGQPIAPQSPVSMPAQSAAAQQAQAIYPQQSLSAMQTQLQPTLPQSATSPAFVSASTPASMPTDGGEVMLLGTYTPKIDAKGRMALPAKFRTQLGPGLIMARGQERCVYLFPQAEFRRVAMQIQHTSLGNKAAREYLRVLLSGAVDQTPDKQGRVLVPQMLRDYAKLGSDIVVIGVGTRAEIWDKKAWQQYLADNEQGYADIADDVLPSVEW